MAATDRPIPTLIQRMLTVPPEYSESRDAKRGVAIDFKELSRL